MILHQTANTALLHQRGRTLTVMATDMDRIKPLAANISLKNRIENEQYLTIPHAFTFGQQSWIVLDSTGVYPPKMETPPHLLLSQSPRINMERLLDSLQPLIVIADGSNYKSFVARWKESCKIRQIPFHSTSEDGAFIRELQP
jgi:competence protein ComEC